MNSQYIVLSDGHKIFYQLKKSPVERGFIVILHGANEHKFRYSDFQNELFKRGYSSICSDRRGHGESISHEYPLGHMGKLDRILQDEIEFFQFITKIYKGKDIFLFSHSYGAILARLLLKDLDIYLKGLLITGTIPYKKQALLAYFLAKIINLGQNPKEKSPFLTKRGYGTNSKDLSWITTKPEKLASYKSDPLCRFHYSRQSYTSIFQGNLALRKRFQAKNPELAILSLVGKKDPMVNGTQGHKKSLMDLRKKGYRNIDYKEYDNFHHEILNEDSPTIFEDILSFLNKK